MQNALVWGVSFAGCDRSGNLFATYGGADLDIVLWILGILIVVAGIAATPPISQGVAIAVFGGALIVAGAVYGAARSVNAAAKKKDG